MAKNRLEAFSDGVLAIIITVMVLELKRPDSSQFSALWALAPILLWLAPDRRIERALSDHHP
jgi:TMEM175 potassium channel family protein